METDFGVGRSSGMEEDGGKQLETQEQNGAQDMAVVASGLGTPQHSNRGLAIPTSASQSGPITRSMTRSQRASHTNDGPKTLLLGRLLGASSQAVDRTAVSRLEDAKDIEYIEVPDRDDGEGAGEDLDSGPNKPRKRKLRASTESRDASEVGASVGSSITAKPASRPVRSQSSRPSKRQKSLAGGPPKLPFRRSARLAKPLTQFHKYPVLPPELKIMVFEAVVSPRLVYVQNRGDPVPQPQPGWFMTNSISVAVAKASYQKMLRQDVNPAMDIVALEPCCGGCRAYHCAHRHFTMAERSAVRFLAVQMEPTWLETLPYMIAPVWVTVNMAWPGVEILYLMKKGLTGDANEEKAVIRCQEGQREAELRSRFAKWKKTTEGAAKKIAQLEFVVVVPKESSSSGQGPLERYQDVEERATGRAGDIIVG